MQRPSHSQKSTNEFSIELNSQLHAHLQYAGNPQSNWIDCNCFLYTLKMCHGIFKCDSDVLSLSLSSLHAEFGIWFVNKDFWCIFFGVGKNACVKLKCRIGFRGILDLDWEWTESDLINAKFEYLRCHFSPKPRVFFRILSNKFDCNCIRIRM